MQVRRVATSFAAALTVVCGLAFALAPAASADTVTGHANCTSGGPDQQLTVSPGDTIEITDTSGTPCAWASTNLVAYPTMFSSYAGGLFGAVVTEPLIWILADDAPLGATDPFFLAGTSIGLHSNRYSLLVVARAATTSNGIPMWVQEYGRPSADAPCAQGWGPSWSRWPNEATGGFVCHRIIKAVGN